MRLLLPPPTNTPPPVLPEMTLRCETEAPRTTFPEELTMATPAPELERLTVPVASRPMMLPSTRLLPPDWSTMPLPPTKRLMTSPRTVESPALMTRPEAEPFPAPKPELDETMLAPR